MKLSGWGRTPVADCRLLSARGADEVLAAIAASPCLIARGNGRSYGDAALQPAATLSLLPSDRIIAFDETTGLLTCEAGLLLSDIIDLFLPRGWFPPVTPGTKFVTIGGMIAADVHGKNHHQHGGFGRHVDSFQLALASGQVVTCSRDENPGLFTATCGGMGLTGVILTATFRLRRVGSRYISQQTVRAPDLDAAMELFETNRTATYTVAWIDCLASGSARGRSIFAMGEHAGPGELNDVQRAAPFDNPAPRQAKSIPVDFPALALNRFSVRAFNALYYRLPRAAHSIVDYDPFFYPLDALHNWNRIYGKRGFLQYQCVLPKESSRAGLLELLEIIGSAGMGSFLAVLKLLGAGDFPLSFAMEGYTLALDFPYSDGLQLLLDRLDAVTDAHGGRVYLAKDARLSPHSLAHGYPQLDRFRQLRQQADPAQKFSSLLSERLGL